MKSDDKERKDSKQLWKSAFNKIKPAAIKPTTENDIIDTVRVRISVNSDYLQEIAKGKVSHELFNETFDFSFLSLNIFLVILDQLIRQTLLGDILLEIPCDTAVP